MRTILIGNPENRRVTLFQDALVAAGESAAEVVSYRELLADPDAFARLEGSAAIVRQDSAGEDFEVERALLHLGHERALELGCRTVDPARIDAMEPDRGRIICPRQAHLGFLVALERVQAATDRNPAWTALQPTDGIAFLFDKRETSRRWHADGIAVPESLGSLQTFDQLRRVARERELREVYIKVSCSSSASCLAVYTPRGPRDIITTTIECADTGWYNSLKLRRYGRPAQVSEVVDFLLGEGAQVEVGVPKARLAGDPFDIRFVVIDGEAKFGLVRQNRHTITNLHLGGWRGDWQLLERETDPACLAAARADAERAAAASGCFVVGVDVLIEPDSRGHRVIEGNAFGDLLPGLERDGLSVYGWQIARARERWATMAL